MVATLLVVVGLLLPVLQALPQWNIALSSRVDDQTFYYSSPVWNSTSSFNTSSYLTNNALFPSYSSVYVQKIRITMDGTSSKTCGSNCVFTFSVPSEYSGKFTLRELVMMEGGVELLDDRNIKWVSNSTYGIKRNLPYYYYQLLLFCGAVRFIYTVTMCRLTQTMTTFALERSMTSKV